jgi:hypothetical protein
MKRWLKIFGGLLILAATAKAAQIRGTIIEAGGGSATVKVEGALAPAPGDSVEIFFTLPGSGDEVSVAKGTVRKVDGDSVQISVRGATGEVEKGHLVRINSAKPQERTTKTARPTATPAASAKGTPPPLKARGKSKAGPKASGPTTAPSPEKKRFAGNWWAETENPPYMIVLSEHGKVVTGYYGQDGSVRGEVRGNTLLATWRQGGTTTVRVGGSTMLKLSDDGQTLSGPWNYDVASNAIGYNGGGSWTLRRMSGSR